jgi:hypothetical protein
MVNAWHHSHSIHINDIHAVCEVLLPTRTSNTSKPQERELKLSPMRYQGKTNTATYTTTRDAMIQYIRKNYKGGINVGESMEDMSKVDLEKLQPSRDISIIADPIAKVVDQAGLDIKYQEELRRHLGQKDALRDGIDKAYALIFSQYCTKVVQSRIKQHPNYDTQLKNNLLLY